MASRALQAGAQICSQHLAGVTNIVADILSFEGGCRGTTNPITTDCPPNDVLTERVHKFYSQPGSSKWFPNSPVARRNRVLRSIGHATSSEFLLDSKGEAAFEKGDRYWRQWECFLREWGVVGNPLLDSVSSHEERLLLARGYVSYHRSFDFNHREKLQQSVRSPLWYRRLFETPLAVWHRRSGKVEGPAPSTFRTESMKQDRSTRESD